MEKSRFFNSLNGDRKYLAEDFAAYFAALLSNGVFLHQTNALKVSAYSGLKIKIAAGQAYINGYSYENTADLQKTLTAVTGSRIDRVVVRLDLTTRTISIAVKSGTPATTPVAPALTRTADVYELGLADIMLTTGTTTVTSAMITDLRTNSTYCGGVTMRVDRDEFLGDITRTFAEFTQASSRSNINTNETMDVILGKIKKHFADLGTLAFLSTVNTSNLAASAVTNAKLGSGAVTDAKVADNAAIAQSKISGLVAALAAKLEASGSYPDLTAGNATKATGDQNGVNIAENCIRFRRLANADTAYNAKDLSTSVSWNIAAPSNAADFILVHGMLTCANKYEITCLLRKNSFLGYSWDAIKTIFVRSVNGTTNVSYGLISLELHINGNNLYLYANHPKLDGGYDDHAASGCYFALEGVYELINSNK